MSNTWQLSLKKIYLFYLRKRNLQVVLKDEISLSFCLLGRSEDFNLRNFFGKTLKTPQDETILTQLEERLPKFLEVNGKSSRSFDREKD